MTKYHEAGKGSDTRPTDHNKFSSGYDLIWGKKKNSVKVQDICVCDNCGEEYYVDEGAKDTHVCQKENPSA